MTVDPGRESAEERAADDFNTVVVIVDAALGLHQSGTVSWIALSAARIQLARLREALADVERVAWALSHGWLWSQDDERTSWAWWHHHTAFRPPAVYCITREWSRSGLPPLDDQVRAAMDTDRATRSHRQGAGTPREEGAG